MSKIGRQAGVWRLAQSISVALLQVALGAANAELPENGAHKHMGVASCATSQCHGSAVPRDGTGVLQNEYVTWTRDDPHAKAYEVLGNDQSLAIAARLGLTSARTADICLDCHADNVPLGRRGDRFQISDGVGCESCHGGSEKWLATHYNVPAVSRADRVAAGLYPTDRLPDRADLCLSCHLGTSKKFATHRIMAAGHPRLSFELDTFGEIWRTSGRQPHYRIDDDYRERKGAVSHSYTWAVGLLAEGRRRLALIQDPQFFGQGMFPELALYDCHACHRSMKDVQWRSLPRHGTAGPGAPFVNDSSFVMALALARSVQPAEADALEVALAGLHVAGSDSADAIRSAAANLDSVLRRMQSGLGVGNLRGQQRKLLIEILSTGADGNYLDYVSAEHAFMAVQMLIIELDDAGLEAELDALAESLQDDERYRPAQFARLLARLGDR